MKTTLIVVLMLLLGFSHGYKDIFTCRDPSQEKVVTAVTCNLDNGWTTPFNGYQYKVITSQQTYEVSRAQCQNLGGDLAAVGMRKIPLRSTICNALGAPLRLWIGLNDIAQEGHYVWVDGFLGTAENIRWSGTGNPDNSGNEDCAEMVGNEQFKVNDLSCSAHRAALCEKPI